MGGMGWDGSVCVDGLLLMLMLLTYTWVFRMDTVALGVCGERMTEAAMKPEIMNATVIMKLDEFWRRTSEECILSEIGLLSGGGGGVG